MGPVLKWNNVFSQLIFCLLTFKFLLFNKYNIIHAFPYIAGIPVSLIGFFKKTPVVFSIFALSSLYKNNKSISEKLIDILENIIVFRLPYDLLITDNLILSRTKINKPIIYIPNGVDINLFDQIKISKSKITKLLYIGRFHKQKGINVLLKAISILTKRLTNFQLVMIGWGPEKAFILKQIQNYQLNTYVIVKYPLYNKKLISEYKSSHILLLPSLYEGQGIVVLEAWASKIPVIATKVGTLQYLVRDGYNGYLVNPNKPIEMAKTIYKLIRSRKREWMGLNGYHLVKKEYLWEKSVDCLYKAYLQLI